MDSILGFNLLTVVGFKPSVDKEAVHEVLLSRQKSEDNEAQVAAEIQLSESDFFSVFLFKLIEPSPDVDTERWISWYDELSECVKIFTVSS